MTAEDRLRLKIGELVMTIAFLEAQIAAKDTEIAALTPTVQPPAPLDVKPTRKPAKA